MDGTDVSGTTVRDGDVNGRLFRGLGDGPHPGVLVLHGAGGARGYEQTYAAMLAAHGYSVFCVEYFGAPGLRESLVDVPLEEFESAANWLLDSADVRGDSVGVVGFSRGGEAALLVGSTFDSVGVVVAYVPSCYVWAAPSWMRGVGEDQPSWTLNGEPVPYLPIDRYITNHDDLGEPLGGDEPSASTLALERASRHEIERATIPVETVDGPVLLISGGRDTVWPCSLFAERAAERLARHDHPWAFEHRCFREAGHAIRAPYQFDESVDADGEHRYGGTNEVNAEASARAWVDALEFLARGLGR